MPVDKVVGIDTATGEERALSAGTGITIGPADISATGGGGSLDPVSDPVLIALTGN
jgi:hypothetical protein